jgi:3-hydroxyisobutyrate dehydrogenase-like beta-hydroxyacid dehydrogenase
MGLVTESAERTDAWTPLAATARALFQSGHEQGLGRKDDSAILTVLARGVA